MPLVRSRKNEGSEIATARVVRTLQSQREYVAENRTHLPTGAFHAEIARQTIGRNLMMWRLQV
jgi:hypothetical protein